MKRKIGITKKKHRSIKRKRRNSRDKWKNKGKLCQNETKNDRQIYETKVKLNEGIYHDENMGKLLSNFWKNPQ